MNFLRVIQELLVVPGEAMSIYREEASVENRACERIPAPLESAGRLGVSNGRFTPNEDGQHEYSFAHSRSFNLPW